MQIDRENRARLAALNRAEDAEYVEMIAVHGRHQALLLFRERMQARYPPVDPSIVSVATCTCNGKRVLGVTCSGGVTRK